MRCSAGDAEGLQALNPSRLRRHSLWDIDQRLCGLPVRYGRNHSICCGVDCGYRISILDADIDARTVSGGPDAMRQVSDRNSRDLLESVRKVFTWFSPPTVT